MKQNTAYTNANIEHAGVFKHWVGNALSYVSDSVLCSMD